MFLLEIHELDGKIVPQKQKDTKQDIKNFLIANIDKESKRNL